MSDLLFLDTEFNGLRGKLISLALVSYDGRVFYEVASTPREDEVDPFVAEHVLPKLEQRPIGYFTMARKCVEWLKPFDGATVVADWPADFEHLCRLLTEVSAEQDFVMPLDLLTMKLVTSPPLKPANPHNALSDALALRDWWMSDWEKP
jgi:hypothetical protein